MGSGLFPVVVLITGTQADDYHHRHPRIPFGEVLEVIIGG